MPKPSSFSSSNDAPAPSHDTANDTANDNAGPSREDRTTVLLAADDRIFSRLGVKLLTHLGYDVLEADDGCHCLDLFDEHRETIALVLLDVTMLDPAGFQLLVEIRRRRGDQPVLLMSGEHADLLPNLPRDERTGFIRKPFRMKALDAEIRKLLRAAGRQSA